MFIKGGFVVVYVHDLDETAVNELGFDSLIISGWMGFGEFNKHMKHVNNEWIEVKPLKEFTLEYIDKHTINYYEED